MQNRTGQAVVLAKDLVESVMQRIGVTNYAVLGAVKGAELELLRFTHPFYGLRRSGNPRRSRYPGCRYRCMRTTPGHSRTTM
ncbi:hypothetical protein ACLK1S_00140 [Escherichia coli]